MSALVKAAIDAELATIERIVDTPVAPFGYGSDISGAADLDEAMTEVDGFTTLALAQALVRRLDCPRGALLDDLDYGIDVRSFVNRPTTTAEINALAGQIRAELLKDDRVESLTVIVAPTPTGSAMAISLSVLPVDARLGPFRLTLGVTSAELLIQELAAG